MMQAISATYDGEKFVLDENINLTTGQKAIVTILDEEIEYPQKNMNEEEIHAWIKKYSGSCGKMFNSSEDVEKYISELREDRTF